MPSLSHAFTAAAPKMTNTGAATSTRLAARDPVLPLLRRSRIMHDFDRMFNEMDELMENSLASFPRQRPFLSLVDKNLPKTFNYADHLDLRLSLLARRNT